MKFKDLSPFLPAAIAENYAKLTPEALEELVSLLQGLETEPEKTIEEVKQWLRNHPTVRDAVVSFAQSPDRENVNSPRRKPSSEAEILQNLFELRQVARSQKDKQPKNR